MRKIGIYVQVPFCQTKCTYCNFHTGVVASSRFAPYVEAVCGEIRGHRELLVAAGVGLDSGSLGRMHGQDPSRERGEMEKRGLFHEATADTVYIGGGTPSLLDPAHLHEILGAIQETFDTSAEGEGRGLGGGWD
jgi:oxygen-independent coproporphyrinogen III oxidase